MKRLMGGLLGGRTGSSTGNANSKSLTAAEESQQLQEAMVAAAHIMNDDLELAETELSKGSTPFHKLGRATSIFLRAVMGLEKETMAQAGVALAEAEASSAEYQRRAQRDPSSSHQSSIYPPGSEYALCHAEATLMLAVLAVLKENLTETLKGFMGLRTAFATLHKITEAETKYLEANGISPTGVRTSQGQQTAGVGSKTPGASSGSTSVKDDDDEEFVDLKDDALDTKTPEDFQERLEKLSDLDLDEKNSTHLNGSLQSGVTVNAEAAAEDATHEMHFETITSDPIDLFIHSGNGLCYGLLKLMLSMVPPAFSRVLSLFAFRGDREVGLRMLWSATRFKHNINGAMAGLMILVFHNGPIAVCDIQRKESWPEARLKALLRDMRQLYPKSKLWLLEEAIMLAANRELEQAVQLISGENATSSLKQVEALRVFEYSLNCVYMHRYEESAKAFMDCLGKNNWSHAVYYYIAGSCYIELYRIHKTSEPTKAEEYAAKADEYLRKVPEHAGKKRFMSRQMPLEVFVNRKIAKWEQRSKAWDCKFVDAVGVSPVVEMAFFWSGFKRMNTQQLQTSLERLAWSEDPDLNPHCGKEPADEKAICALLTGSCLRSLDRVSEAKAILKDKVMSHDLVTIKACEHPDTWPLPVAHYEMAVCLWQEAGGQTGDKAILAKCSEELAKIEKWESYELEARVGLKVATGRETLRACGISS